MLSDSGAKFNWVLEGSKRKKKEGNRWDEQERKRDKTVHNVFQQFSRSVTLPPVCLSL